MTKQKEIESSKIEYSQYLLDFKHDVSHIQLPEKFTFPFYYDPHPLTLQAVDELLPIIQNIPIETYDFDLANKGTGMGKMFGVLVVQLPDGTLKYLAAFSGKVGELSHFKPFVPPIFNRLTNQSFYMQGESVLNEINTKVEALSTSEAYAHRKAQVNAAKEELLAFQKESKSILKAAKKVRDQRRKQGEAELDTEAFEALKEELAHESIARQLKVKHDTKRLQDKLDEAQAAFDEIQNEINQLKEERKQISGGLQEQLFKSYLFLNAKKETKDVAQIFQDFSGIVPPAGAGECAAPKLLHAAYSAGWKPVCMSEFWYGRSPATEVRKHMHYYPACRSKCEPILGFMLQGLAVDENPIVAAKSEHLSMDIIHDDADMVVVNKPSGLLSVPGKEKTDSVYERITKLYPSIEGPVIVHRLDMDTSGIMVLAKTKLAHKKLQEQFIQRTTKKRYVAVLEGELDTDEGSIDLPLRVDLDNRPHQMVCYEHGKPAFTRYKVLSIENGRTRIHFYPHTGRTHQLRMHAAHTDGLNAPIVGDDLYGKKGERLHLHAEQLKLVHPSSSKRMNIQCEAPF